MELVKWDEIGKQIDIERDLKTLKKYHSVLASKELRKQLDGSINGINKCERYKIKIEMAIGDQYKNLGSEQLSGLKQFPSLLEGTTDKQQAAKDIDKSRKTLSKYTQISNVDKRDELLNNYESVCNEKSKEMSSAGFLKFTRENQYNEIPQPEIPNNKYRIIYADPPWKYGNTMPIYFTEQADYYPLMTIKQIIDLAINVICEDNAVLFLWVTSPILEESFQVIDAWGFKYKSSFVWDKIKHNMGHYNSVRHEFLLIATRGSCQPDVKKLYDSVQSIERTKHSAKPEEFRKIIDIIYPNGKRIELFPRGSLPDKWEGWGNEYIIS